jgi:hypothetical protein
MHPLNPCELGDSSDPEAAELTVTAPSAPDERVPVIVPVGRGALDRPFDRGPGLGWKHIFPAPIQRADQQHVGRAVDVQMVEHRVTPLDRRADQTRHRSY